MKSGKKRFVGACLAALALAGVLHESDAQRLDVFRGWNGAHITSAHEGLDVANDAKIDGQVGHEILVPNPWGNCSAGNWRGTVNILSGSLPPGLFFDSRNDSIVGIPTERGHWIVVLSYQPLSCGGKTFYGFQQRLFFHIGGTGKVIQ